MKVSFLSMVGHAANGLPYSVVKEEGEQPASQEPMAKNTTALPEFGGKTGVSLNRIELDRTVFKTEAEVQTYLDEVGITARAIEETETHFIAKGVNEDSLESVEAVKGDRDGITYFIGKLKASLPSIKPASPLAPPAKEHIAKNEDGTPKARLRGDEEEGDDAVVKYDEPIEEVVVKMDTWIARQTGTLTFDDTMNSGEAELPGLWMIQDAIHTTVRNIVSKAPAAEVAGLIQACYTRGGEVASALASVFVSLQKNDEGEGTIIRRADALKHFSSPAPAGVMQKAEESPTPAPDAEAGQQQQEGEQEAPTPEAGAEQPAGNVLKMEDIISAVKETVTTALEPVIKSAASIEGRVAELEAPRQIRKSEPSDDTPEGGTVQKSEADKEREARQEQRIRKEEEERKADLAFAEKQRRQKFGMV